MHKASLVSSIDHFENVKFVEVKEGTRVSKKTFDAIHNLIPSCWNPSFKRFECQKTQVNDTYELFMVFEHEYGIVKFRLCVCRSTKDQASENLVLTEIDPTTTE